MFFIEVMFMGKSTNVAVRLSIRSFIITLLE